MGLTGELEHLHIVDIIQLLHTTRKSGTFSVKSSRGESRIIFSNGYIVGASHLNNKIRIGSVLVKMGLIALKDLEDALEVQRKAGKNRKPLLATLIEMGGLKPENASRALKKLIEIAIVELLSWNSGTFTFDTEDIPVTQECSYPIGRMEQGMSLDAQMVLMDALRVFDERERDRQSGKEVLSYEEVFADVIAAKAESGEYEGKERVLTAEDLGLEDLDHMERKMPEFVPVHEVFNPAEIHRQKIRQCLEGFSAEEQETFVSFLDGGTVRTGSYEGSTKQKVVARAVVLFSGDELIKHAVMTICKNEGVLVFATDGEEELDRIIAQCLQMKLSPVLVFDAPDGEDGMLFGEKVINMRRQVRERYPVVPIIQLAPRTDYAFMLRALHDGIRVVFPKPLRGVAKTSFINDTIAFLEAFDSYIEAMFSEEREPVAVDSRLGRLKERVLAFREIKEPSEVFSSLLNSVAEVFERAVTFIVRPTELAGDRSMGISGEKREGPASAAGLKIPLTVPSVFRDVIEKGQPFCGECDDGVLREHLFKKIGSPRSPYIVLFPVRSSGKTIALVYGDFGRSASFPVETEGLEIVAHAAGLILENVLYRRRFARASQR